MRVDRISVADESHVWIAANGHAWRSTDGGSSFEDRTPPALRPATGEDEARLDDVLALSDTHLMLLEGTTEEDAAKTTALFVSNDGAQTFVARKAPRFHGGRGARLQRGLGGSVLIRRSDGNGMNSHADSVVITGDDGITFRDVGTKTGYGEIAFQTPTTWWVMGTCCASSDSLYRSTNAGRSWGVVLAGSSEEESKKPPTAPPDSGIVFLDATRGYFVRQTKDPEVLALAVTKDGGRTFVDAPIPYRAMHVLHASAGACAIDAADAAVVTRDVGKTWSGLPKLPNGVTYTQLEPLGKAGWIALASGPKNQDQLYVTKDGRAWTQSRFPAL